MSARLTRQLGAFGGALLSALALIAARPSAVGQCVDFSSLGSSDQVSVRAFCLSVGGTWGSAPCPTTGRLGTCQVPPLGDGTEVHCSSTGLILERYYVPYTTMSAQDICATVPGAVFTPG